MCRVFLAIFKTPLVFYKPLLALELRCVQRRRKWRGKGGMFRGQIRNEIISFSLQHRKIGYLKRRLVEILIPCKTTGLKPFYNQFHQSTSGERRKRDIRGLSGFFVLLEAT